LCFGVGREGAEGEGGRRYQDDVFDVFERHFGGMKSGGLAKFMVKVA